MRPRRWLLLALLAALARAQDAPPNGPRRVDPMWHALVGATVHVAPGRTIEDATVILKGTRIVDVSRGAPPEGARIWDAKGLDVYAGLIDAYVPVDVPPGEPRHWNPGVTPERLAREVDNRTAAELRGLGFTAAAVAPRAGILRGRVSLVSLAPREEDLSVPRPTVYAEGLWQAAGFDRARQPEGGRGREAYPTSEMGAIALLRQSLLDGLAPGEPLLFDTDDELEALRAAKIAREFGRKAAIVGSGTEFRRLDAIAKDGLPFLVPLDLPEPPDVSSVGARDAADLRDLMTWEQAPTNPRRLDGKGIQVALTTAKLDKRDRFPKALAEAMRIGGLTEERALAMLTTTPATLLGASDRMGTVEAGKLANLVVSEGPLFVRDPVVREVWIEGKRYEVTPPPAPASGAWTIAGQALPSPLALEVKRKGRGGYEATLSSGDRKTEARKLSVVGDAISFTFDADPLGGHGRFTLSAVAEAEGLRGEGVGPDGGRFSWSASRAAGAPPAAPGTPAPEEAPPPETYGTPFGPYAMDGLPQEADRLIVLGATLWTCGPKGVIENGELEVRKGKIVYAGPRRGDPGDATVLDATGRHLTPGIVDCHSHTGISKGVNESGQAVTAEVRISDVTDPDSVSWYRQLAGGVTTVNSLHGSANPIGGQNQVNKIRWGVSHPDEMHFEGAPPGIKFALGENVKQSNWGDDFTTRYPQTRMGVEALMRDRLEAAREYAAHHDRRDLELEALAEVLEGKRLVHCHSYRQDEILMLCRLAREFGFRIGTFQHVLEGYKVADAIRDNSGGGSTFSDWWAYKVEVEDAIPWNGALMRANGVCVSFNSDSDEMARRLNLEAAKAVKYGDVPPDEALKFVTLNAAKQLGIDDRVGSLEEGKDADFAIWSGPPLSVYSRCVATWIDGREYFSLEQDAKHRERIAADRRRIIAKILSRPKEEDGEGPGEGKPPAPGSETWSQGECGCRGDR
jgi:imidazolonepropionase-like amidohydrolase